MRRKRRKLRRITTNKGMNEEEIIKEEIKKRGLARKR